MRISDSFVDAWSGRVLSILRIIVAFLFMTHGMGKLFAFPVSAPNGFHLASLIGAAGLLEFFGGLLLLIGLFTRPVAFILSGEMAFAYFLGHASHGFWPIVNRGELAVVYCFVFLYLAVAGAGVYSLDALWHGRTRRNDARPSFGARGA